MLPPAAPHRRARRTSRSLVVLAAVTTALAAGCRGTTTPSAAAFCRRIEANRAALAGPVIDAASVARVLAAYRTLGSVAPVAVRDAWTTVTALLDSAASLDPAQPKAAEALAARALAAKPEIDRIVSYTRTTCNVDIGAAVPVAPPSTVAPAGRAPASADPAAGEPTTEAPGTIPPTAAPKKP